MNCNASYVTIRGMNPITTGITASQEIQDRVFLSYQVLIFNYCNIFAGGRILNSNIVSLPQSLTIIDTCYCSNGTFPLIDTTDGGAVEILDTNSTQCNYNFTGVGSRVIINNMSTFGPGTFNMVSQGIRVTNLLAFGENIIVVASGDNGVYINVQNVDSFLTGRGVSNLMVDNLSCLNFDRIDEEATITNSLFSNVVCQEFNHDIFTKSVFSNFSISNVFLIDGSLVECQFLGLRLGTQPVIASAERTLFTDILFDSNVETDPLNLSNLTNCTIENVKMSSIADINVDNCTGSNFRGMTIPTQSESLGDINLGLTTLNQRCSFSDLKCSTLRVTNLSRSNVSSFDISGVLNATGNENYPYMVNFSTGYIDGSSNSTIGGSGNTLSEANLPRSSVLVPGDACKVVDCTLGSPGVDSTIIGGSIIPVLVVGCILASAPVDISPQSTGNLIATAPAPP